MIYKNTSENEKLFFKKWATRIAAIYAFALVFYALLILISIWLDESFHAVWHIFIFSYGIGVCVIVALPFIVWKKVKKNYYSYSFEITDDEIIAFENGVEKRIKSSEITKVVQVKKKKYKICSKFAILYTSDFVENLDEMLARIAQIKTPQPDRYTKITTVLSWIFIGGFLIIRRIPNVTVPLFVFFGIGFIVMAVISLVDFFRSSSKTWVKIYMLVLYGILIASVLWTFWILAKMYFG